MNKKLLSKLLLCFTLLLLYWKADAQINLIKDYQNNYSKAIGTFQGINFREAGFSTLFPIAGTDGKEFWTLSDRGVNVDAANANPSTCRPTYDKIFAFKDYAPKIFRIKLKGDSVQIVRTIAIKRPNKSTARGVLNPTSFGSTAAEEASTDTVLDCNNFAGKKAAKDTFALDPEGLIVDKDGNFWVSEENGPTIWKINPNGVLVKRFTPYAAQVGATSVDVAIDTCFKYRKSNRGFESLAIAPNGKIYALIQSPILYPTKSIGEGTRVHRILEIDPVTNAQRMFVYLNDGIIGASGANQIRLRDWKVGDMAAINDSTFLVLEAALRGTSDYKRVYQININQATAINSGLYGGKTVEALVDSTGLAIQGIKAVKKTLFMDLLANSWPASLEKAEGIAIVNDSTIFVNNDNDFGQVSTPENGIATATGFLSHVFQYSLKGNNKLKDFVPTSPILTSNGSTANNSSQAPYIQPTIADAQYTAILTVGDKANNNYAMVGIPDGLGAYDNNDGTFTVLMNHELGNSAGIARAHGNKGAFVSKWIINKNDLSVVSGADLANTIKLWDTTTNAYLTYNQANPMAAGLGRFCSADLPAVSAFYNEETGKGTQERIFMNGEETGAEGRAFGHIATGVNAGISYELPYLGKYSWENALASPYESDTTIVAGTDDATPGQVYFYMGTKTNTGTEIEKAGLSNGKLYSPAVSGMLTEVSNPFADTVMNFTMKDLGNVKNTTGAKLQTNSSNSGVTQFLRPEDGAWDPNNPTDFYFATTNGFTNPSRLWRMRFRSATDITKGGIIQAVLNGTEGQKMVDNIAIDNSGHILLTEDVGGQDHLGKTWQYTIATDQLKQIAVHDSTRFITGSANFLTRDEEASGQIDVQNILGSGMFLVTDQAHYSISGESVEGGQFLAFNNPDTKNNNPEIAVTGNGVEIADNELSASFADSTDFDSINTGKSIIKTFVIKNNGTGTLLINSLKIKGTDASQFTLVAAPALPLNVAAASTQAITVKFVPTADGVKNASIVLINNDFDEEKYSFAIKGTAVSPEVNVQGNMVDIVSGDATPAETDFTDFDTLNTNKTVTKTFVLQNKGQGVLTLSAISITGADSLSYSIVSAPSLPLSLQAAGKQNIQVKFAPTTDGVKNAKLHLVTDDTDEADYNFAIKGTAVSPEINVLGNNIKIVDGALVSSIANNTKFDTLTVGTNTSKQFVIQNTGTAPLSISAISFTGNNTSDFTLVASPAFPLNIAAAGSQTVTVKFAPSAAGLRTATINIASNDADEVLYDFVLEGAGKVINAISSINTVNGISLFPNPSENIANLSFNLKTDEKVSVKVYDLQGKLLINNVEQLMNAGEQKVALNTATLASGKYIVSLTVGTQSANINLVVAH